MTVAITRINPDFMMTTMIKIITRNALIIGKIRVSPEKIFSFAKIYKRIYPISPKNTN